MGPAGEVIRWGSVKQQLLRGFVTVWLGSEHDYYTTGCDPWQDSVCIFVCTLVCKLVRETAKSCAKLQIYDMTGEGVEADGY